MYIEEEERDCQKRHSNIRILFSRDNRDSDERKIQRKAEKVERIGQIESNEDYGVLVRRMILKSICMSSQIILLSKQSRLI